LHGKDRRMMEPEDPRFVLITSGKEMMEGRVG
jgi:hypothetical protein